MNVILFYCVNMFKKYINKLLYFQNPTKQDILLDILKLNRAIYYQLKNIADNKAISTNIKKSMIQKRASGFDHKEGKGLSDDIKPDILKSMSYNELKHVMEE